MALGLMLVTRPWPWPRWLDGRPPSSHFCSPLVAAALARAPRARSVGRRARDGGSALGRRSTRRPAEQRQRSAAASSARRRRRRRRHARTWNALVVVPRAGARRFRRRPPRHCTTPSSSSLPHLALAAAAAVVRRRRVVRNRRRRPRWCASPAGGCQPGYSFPVAPIDATPLANLRGWHMERLSCRRQRTPQLAQPPTKRNVAKRLLVKPLVVNDVRL